MIRKSTLVLGLSLILLSSGAISQAEEQNDLAADVGSDDTSTLEDTSTSVDSTEDPSNALSPCTILQKVPLYCKNPGSHQDVAKTPSISNPGSIVVPVKTWVYWTSTDKDGGKVLLEKALKPRNANTVQVIGHPGNSYSCAAHYFKCIKF